MSEKRIYEYRRHLMICMLLMMIFIGCRTTEAALNNVVLIGDSRTNEMHDTVGDYGCSWAAADGMGYDWMVSQGVPNMESMIGEGTAVVILMGVNDVVDTFRITEYADYLNERAAEWGKLGAVTYFVSILPVEGIPEPGVDNGLIEYWNGTIQSLLDPSVVYLDVFNELGVNYRTVDGLHYNHDTYRRIFDFILAGVYANQNSGGYSYAEEDDELDVPQMKYTAADTEDKEVDNETYIWIEQDGSLRCTDQNGRALTGFHIIGKMICVFGDDGVLTFSRRQ